ncbi:hypothetical protein PPL_10561 [Heterostelium album PN500]|uniref:Uncharacterized protein n=1 Tax=Heterostelium pallidum (strain ATCC 26659 / Pp 5 / PN500) TaxID=670386 RepID=D3BRF1_HETP5|nr:hypothetical protein PPL_10561 [Heterostelium album PN500]EFA75983.1 hypothetical protein PPL_10561 [Heterostelium album PN500]|eukprot:XP_020428117.1 hypothetical protein PPL_10561 [Heterostelium album PN500]
MYSYFCLQSFEYILYMCGVLIGIVCSGDRSNSGGGGVVWWSVDTSEMKITSIILFDWTIIGWCSFKSD